MLFFQLIKRKYADCRGKIFKYALWRWSHIMLETTAKEFNLGSLLKDLPTQIDKLNEFRKLGPYGRRFTGRNSVTNF